MPDHEARIGRGDQQPVIDTDLTREFAGEDRADDKAKADAEAAEKAKVAAAKVDNCKRAQQAKAMFDTGKADVKPESKPSLEQIAAFLKAEPAVKLHVVGHTDSVGSFDSNLALSKRRADAVAAVLAKDYGIAANRLVGNGVASLAPVASNSSDEGKAKNRRVELVLQ